jgi:hypothetical protein
MRPETLLVAAGLVSACRPDLPAPSASDDPAATVEVAFVPPLGPAAERVLRVRVAGAAAAAVGAEDVVLVAGELGDRHLDQLADGKPSKALAERILPAARFALGDDVWLAPHVVLDPGELYTVAIAPHALAVPFHVSETALPPLARVFPLPGDPAPSAHLVFCGDGPVGQGEEPAELSPGGPVGRLVTGSPLGGAPRCVRFEPQVPGESPGPWVPPARSSIAARALDPSPVDASATDIERVEAARCEGGEIRFGPGCARVLDDRLALRSPEAALFWAVSGGGAQAAFVTGGGVVHVVKGLTPSSTAVLRVEWLDKAGVWAHADVEVTTGAPRAHFVLNEVYADALGPEPDQEWIEIFNDGSAEGDTAGWVIVDVGGETALPAAALAPGGFALVVPEAFSADSDYDAPPARAALLVRVPKLGTHGLSNAGEALKLLEPSGEVASRFPAQPKPKPGVSVARTAPDAPDGAASSFARAELGPTPGAPNAGSFATDEDGGQ